MTARSYVVEQGKARAVPRDEATKLLGKADFVWVHFDDCDDTTQDWLKTHGHLPDLVVAALIATETRPRMDRIDGGALVNLRGPDAGVIADHAGGERPRLEAETLGPEGTGVGDGNEAGKRQRRQDLLGHGLLLFSQARPG